MPNLDLPAASWLGYSLDLSSTVPVDIGAAARSVQTVRRILAYDPDAGLRSVVIDNVTYNVPEAIGVALDDVTEATYMTYPSGGDASAALRSDPSLAFRFLAVTGDPSVGAVTEKLFRHTDQYAFFSFSQNKYFAELKDTDGLLNEAILHAAISTLPKFDGDNAETLMKYKEFFKRYGTHAIVKVRYGARFQSMSWATNSDTEVNKVWSGNVNAAFDGIPNGGNYDASLKTQDQYKRFLEFLQKLISVAGGDSGLAANIFRGPIKYQNYEDWRKTASTQPTLLNLVVANLWSLMSNSGNDELKKAAKDIQAAFEYIIDTPRVHKTAVSFVVESDWAEFGLVTSNAVVLPGPTVPPMTQFSTSKVNWGKKQSHDYQRQSINFFIVNDGSPVDFYISHGSNGSQEGNGNARATIEGMTYLNDKITDDNTNTMWFYQAPVSNLPESFTEKGSHSEPYLVWDDTLQRYLDSVGTA